MNKKKVPILSVVLYILAGLLMAFAIWSSVQSISYISQMMSQGQLVFSGNEYDIVNFIMTSCVQYVIFAIILFTLGWMLQKGRFGISDNTATAIPAEPVYETPESSAVEDI